jgi:cell division protein FtsI (penicillin-binding protein 3)
MIRTPLRPLARILSARARGEDPAGIEAANRRIRGEALRDRQRIRAERRILLLACGFAAGFGLVAMRMGVLASTPVAEPQAARSGAAIQAQRADITDRRGRVLATNIATHALYAHPRAMIDPARAARELVRIFPELDEAALLRAFDGRRSFVWVRRTLSPEQMQAVHEIGEPGLLFAPRELRLYPNGRLAAHVLGGTTFGTEDVRSAEVIGNAGLEKALDARLRDPARLDQPVVLSLDLTVQAAVTEVLAAGKAMLNAKGAAAIVMEARTGEVVAMVSLPDFDPNDRPPPPTGGDPGLSPIFNRAVQGVYELGSVMKVFPVAQALELGHVRPETVVDTRGPMQLGRFRVRDFRDLGPQLSITDVIVRSSNIGTARLIGAIGTVRQEAYLRNLGFLDPVPLELVEAPTGRPKPPRRWGEVEAATISYGHGLAASPMNLAVGYAALVNGGWKVTPTLLHGTERPPPVRVMAEQTSAEMRAMLRAVVTRGTATMALVPGYDLGGKTGTADKMNPAGGYFDDRVMATFAGAFPMHDPRYVIVVALDEPVETSGIEPRRTAGWTAVPVTGEIVRRIAPLLGLRPGVEATLPSGLTQVRN